MAIDKATNERNRKATSERNFEIMEEYYVEYYDPKGRRGYTTYYLDKREADNKAEDLKSQGYEEVTVVTFRY